MTLRVVGLSVADVDFPTTSAVPSWDVSVTRRFAQKYNADAIDCNGYFFRLAIRRRACPASSPRRVPKTHSQPPTSRPWATRSPTPLRPRPWGRR